MKALIILKSIQLQKFNKKLEWGSAVCMTDFKQLCNRIYAFRLVEIQGTVCDYSNESKRVSNSFCNLVYGFARLVM